MKFNLPTAWLFSCDTIEIETNDDTLLIPSHSGVKKGDVIFIGNLLESRIISETIVIECSGNAIKLLITHSDDSHPLLDYSSLIENDIISPDDCYEFVRLTDRAYIYINTIFKEPSNH